ncbi:MAG: YdcF family protein [Paraglaciecola sp.]|nr:YdcF family protein [Paraglaciecola sp.]NCT49117.1 YdcF family protein [Paraglaciecola sp.]
MKGINHNNIDQQTLNIAKLLWDYQRLDLAIENVDCLLVMGCHDLGVAQHAIDLYQQGLSPFIVFSGGFGKVTRGLWHEPEAVVFAKLAHQAGIDQQHIMVEPNAQNCGENIRFSMQLLAEHKPQVKRVMLVTKPYLERRALATFKRHYPHWPVWISSQACEFADYLQQSNDPTLLINLLVGDLQRILLYPAMGFQVEQTIPKAVLDAYTQLIDLGFHQGLLLKQ